MSSSPTPRAQRENASDRQSVDLSSYELLDFGDGRKWERVGNYVINRPCPAADQFAPKSGRDRWDAKFDRETGQWFFKHPWPEKLLVRFDSLAMPVRPTPFGHIGVFPEQQDNWRWLRRTGHAIALEYANATTKPDVPMGLNLFGYTGASTIALAQTGLELVHVDAAKPNVEATRSVARCNDLLNHPIRYLVDDVAKFVTREVRRGRRYDCIVLDPPAYGHGPKGKTWRLQRDLWPLLEKCLQLLRTGGRMLITGHTDGLGCREVRSFLHDSHPAVRNGSCRLQSGRMKQLDSAGRSLDAGFFVRMESFNNHQ